MKFLWEFHLDTVRIIHDDPSCRNDFMAVSVERQEASHEVNRNCFHCLVNRLCSTVSHITTEFIIPQDTLDLRIFVRHRSVRIFGLLRFKSARRHLNLVCGEGFLDNSPVCCTVQGSLPAGRIMVFPSFLIVIEKNQIILRIKAEQDFSHDGSFQPSNYNGNRKLRTLGRIVFRRM